MPSSTSFRQSIPARVPARTRGSATHWSLIRDAGDERSSRHGRALDDFVTRYWYPLYAFARRQGRSPEDARDLTQGFLSGFIRRNAVASADPARGRFRTFLLTCFRNHLTNEHDRDRAARRGGGQEVLSLDAEAAESRYFDEPSNPVSPDRLFDRAWALATLEQALLSVRSEYAAAGKQDLHDRLRSMLWEDAGEQTYRDLGLRLGMSEAAVKMAVVRLRRRCRLALMEEIARTVRRPEDVEDEYRHVMDALRN